MLLIPEMEYTVLKSRNNNISDNNKITGVMNSFKNNLLDDRLVKRRGVENYIDKKMVSSIPKLKVEIEKKEKSKKEDNLKDKITNNNQWIEEAVEKLPKNNRHRAIQLKNFLKSKDENLQWNERGEIKGKEFGLIPNSNIIDLINYTTSSNLKNKPRGFDKFINVLQEANVPNYLFGKQAVEAVNNNSESSSITVKDNNESMDVFHDLESDAENEIENEREADIHKNWESHWS